MTTRTMGDSVVPFDIPASVAVAGFYVSGPYAITLAEAAARFPVHQYGLAPIDVNATRPDIAWVLDVETGDATPQQAAAWIAQWHKLHPSDGLPVIYCNRATRPAVEAACGPAGGSYLLWVATLDGSQVTGPGVAACQWKGAALTGGHWDESLVYNPNLWLPQVPAPAVTLADCLTLAKQVSIEVTALAADLAKLAAH